MFQSKFGYSKINHENACLRLHKQTKHFCRSNTLYLAMTELVNRNVAETATQNLQKLLHVLEQK